MAVAKKKVGPAAATALKIPRAGCANSLKLTAQLNFKSKSTYI